MSVVDDIADDLALVDGLLTVSITLNRVAGNTTVTGITAQREQVGKNVANYGGMMLQGGETIWHIMDSQLNPAANGRVINAGDEITHGSTVYIVTAVTNKVIGTTWGCVCNTKL